MAFSQESKPVIDLPVVNYELVHAGDPAELQKLFDACRPPPHGLGFFFVDLSGPSGKKGILDMKNIKSSSQAYFTQQHEVKMNDFIQGIDRGLAHYVPAAICSASILIIYWSKVQAERQDRDF